jgi:hypothetical protein
MPALAKDLAKVRMVAAVHLGRGGGFEHEVNSFGVFPVEENAVAGVHDMNDGVLFQHGG